MVVDEVPFHLWKPDSEQAFERLVGLQVRRIFGEDSESFFDLKQRLRSKAGIGSIPDGYVITFTGTPRWHVVEVELASHPPYEHATPQLARFKSAIANIEEQRRIAEAMYGEVTSDPVRAASFKAKIGPQEIYHFISSILANPPVYVVIIDEFSHEWDEALRNFPDVKVVEFRTYAREKVGLEVHSHIFTPLYEAPPPPPPPPPTPPPTERPPENWIPRLRVWKRVLARGGTVTAQELHTIADEVGMDRRGLGGFFRGEKGSLIRTPGGRLTLAPHAIEAVRKYGGSID